MELKNEVATAMFLAACQAIAHKVEVDQQLIVIDDLQTHFEQLMRGETLTTKNGSEFSIVGEKNEAAQMADGMIHMWAEGNTALRGLEVKRAVFEFNADQPLED